jgi:predicted DNA-binding protein with PD1-like motif
MTARELSRSAGGATHVLVFDRGEEVMAALDAWCRDQEVTAARLTGIGAFSDAVLGWFDWEAKRYRQIDVDEQVELLSLTGDVALAEDEPAVHAHVVVGRRDGSTRGGHLLRAHVRPTLELVVDATPAHLRKRHDPESGLALIAPARDDRRPYTADDAAGADADHDARRTPR